MTSIKVIMTEERKKELKRICLENDKTITQYVLDCLDKEALTERDTSLNGFIKGLNIND